MRMERAARERIKRINPNDLETLKPEDLVNARSVVSVVREFLAASQLSNSWIRPIRSPRWPQAAHLGTWATGAEEAERELRSA